MWDLTCYIQWVKAEKAIEVVNGVTKLSGFLSRTVLDEYSSSAHVHQRCIAHIINLAVKYGMHIIQEMVKTKRMNVSSIYSSVKRRDIYGIVCKELKLSHFFLGLDVLTRRFSIFRTLGWTCKARRLLTTTIQRIPELQSCVITDSEWENVRRISACLKQPADITMFQ